MMCKTIRAIIREILVPVATLCITVLMFLVADFSYQAQESVSKFEVTNDKVQYGTMTREFWSGYEKFYKQQTKIFNQLKNSDFSEHNNDPSHISAIRKEFDDVGVDLEKAQLLINNKFFIVQYNKFARSLKIKGWDEFIENTKNAEIEFYHIEEKAHSDIQVKYLQFEHHPERVGDVSSVVKEIQVEAEKQQLELINQQYKQLDELLNNNFKDDGLLSNGS